MARKTFVKVCSFVGPNRGIVFQVWAPSTAKVRKEPVWGGPPFRLRCVGGEFHIKISTSEEVMVKVHMFGVTENGVFGFHRTAKIFADGTSEGGKIFSLGSKTTIIWPEDEEAA